MSNMSQDQLMFFKSICPGVQEAHIRNCWKASNGDQEKCCQYLLGDLQIPAEFLQGNIQQQDDIYGTERQVQQAIKDSLNQIGQYNPRRRQAGKMVGLMNVGNNCSLSVIIQMMLQYSNIFKLLFGCQQGNCDNFDKFTTNLKTLFAQMTLSNKEFCNPRDVLVSMCWENDYSQYVGIQLDVAEMYLNFLVKFDKSIRRLNPDQLLQTVANRQESFGCPQLNNLFSVQYNNNGQVEQHALLIATLEKRSIIEFMSGYNGKIKKLPQALIIQIQRVGYNQMEGRAEKLRDGFIINKELGLDNTLQQQIQQNPALVQYSQKIKQMNPNKIPEIQKQIQALDTIIKDYESDPDGQMVDQLKMLKSRKQFKERELDVLQKEIKELSSQVEQQQRNQQNKYHLHCVVVHIGSAVDGHNFVYIYNFFLQRWLEYNDTNVSFVDEEKVMRDALNNAQMVSYVNQSYIQELKQHNQLMIDSLQKILDDPYRNHRQQNQLCSLITMPEYNQVIQQNQNGFQ